MKRMVKGLAAGLAVIMCLGLGACAKDLDAAGYTKSVLDASYHGEYAEYAKFRDISEEDAKKEVQEQEESMAEEQLAELGSISDDVKAEYIECIRSAGKLAKYEVKEAQKQDDDSYIVQVEISPSDIYTTLEQHATTLMEELSEEEQQEVATNEDAFAKFMIKCLNKAVEENTYGEPVTIEVKVAQDKDNVYGIDDAQMMEIDDALFSK